MRFLAEAWGPAGWGLYGVEWGPGGAVGFEAVSGGVGEGWVVPGFVDVHIHGAYGVDWMSADEPAMRGLAERLVEEDGYETFFPTTITFPVESVERALGVLPDHRAVGGFHLEGPFISPVFPGAQPVEAIEPPPGEGSVWEGVLSDPRLRLVTLAPERAGALDLAQRLSGRGVVVSAGHTDATFAEIEAGVLAGVSHATHTYNAMRGLHHREAGALGAVLARDEVYAELIYDRAHVSRAAAGILLKCKGLERVVAVSDCTMAKGLPEGEHTTMWGHRVVARGGEVRLAEGGALAGSMVTLRDVFFRIAEDFGPEVACRLCCWNARVEFGLRLAPRVWLYLSKNGEIRARSERVS